MTTGTYRARAFLDAARRLDVDVTVGSERAQILAAANPAGHLVVDFRDLEAAAEAIIRFVEKVPLDAVLTADDEGAPIAARVAERLSLRGHRPEGVARARDKLESRRALAAAGRPGPEFWHGERPERVRFPCVLKPRGLSASRGVIRVDDAEGLERAYPRVAALAGESGVLVESYLPGDEVAVEGIVDRGRFVPLAVFDKPHPLEGPYFEETIYVTPTRHPAATVAAIFEETAASAATLELDDGPIHAELRIVEGKPVLIEMAPRSIGGLCSKSLVFDGPRRLEELLLAQALDLPWEPVTREAAASGVMMLPIPRAGRLVGLAGEDQARAVAGISELVWSIPVGQEIVPPPEGQRYLGFLFARSDGPGEVVTALERAWECLEVTVEPTWRSPGATATMGPGETPC